MNLYYEIIRNLFLEDVDREQILNQTIKNPQTDKDIKVRTALQYKQKNRPVYDTAIKFLKKQGISDDEIESLTGNEQDTPADKSKKVDTKNSKSFKQNMQTLTDFITNGFGGSQGAPGSAGSMLNEILSIGNATRFLNDGEEFNKEQAIQNSVNQLKDSELGRENEGNQKAGKVNTREAREIADRYGISIGLASKVLISVQAAEKKYNHVQNRIIRGNNLTNTTSIPFFGDKSGLQSQVTTIENAPSKVFLGNTEVTKEEAIEIIKASGGGENPSDTAIFVIDEDTGNVYMTFYSDKDATNAIQAQSSLRKESEIRKSRIDDYVATGALSQEDGERAKQIVDQQLEEFEKLESELDNAVNAPGEFLTNQSPAELVDNAKKLSSGRDPEKYWKKRIVSKFRGRSYNKYKQYLPQGHSEPPSDEEMMEGYIRWANQPENQGNLPKDDQRVISDLSKLLGGPIASDSVEEIRKNTVQSEMKILEKLDEIKVTTSDGRQVGLGQMTEAQNTIDKLHLNLGFERRKGVMRDDAAFCLTAGDTNVTSDVMKGCLPYDNDDDIISNFEVGEQYEQKSRTGQITGSTRIVFAVTKGGKKYKIGEKRQRSKSGPLGKLQTVYKYDPEFQKCLDSNG